MKKRVAIIIPGGVGAGLFNQGVPALVQLIEGLSNKFDITVYSLVAISPEFKTDKYQLKAINASHHDWTAGRVLRLARMIINDHRKKKYELFHGFWGIPCGSAAVVLGKLLNRPSLVSLQGGEAANVPTINYGYLISEKKKRRLYKTLKAATGVTTLSYFQRDQLRKNGFDDIKMEVIPYGVDTTLFKPSSKELDLPIHFIHIANLTEVKDQNTLLKAFKIIRNTIVCKLKIVGFDALNGEIQKLCSNYGLTGDVSFIGPVQHKNIPEYMNWAHILLHTSLYESQAVVVVEAMASNVLVVGTNVGLINDLDDIAIGVPCEDYQSIAENVLNILQDKREIDKLKLKGLEWASNNDYKTTITHFDELYNRLIKN